SPDFKTLILTIYATIDGQKVVHWKSCQYQNVIAQDGPSIANKIIILKGHPIMGIRNFGRTYFFDNLKSHYCTHFYMSYVGETSLKIARVPSFIICLWQNDKALDAHLFLSYIICPYYTCLFWEYLYF
ncbi:hypothetical protein ACJX0J_041282, partial [Zea mays]